MLGRDSDQFRVAAIEKRSAGNINFFLASLHAIFIPVQGMDGKVPITIGASAGYSSPKWCTAGRGDPRSGYGVAAFVCDRALN
jgi:hypothetical protein